MSTFHRLYIITRPFFLDVCIGIITKEITWSVMITTTDFMVIFPNLIGKTLQLPLHQHISQNIEVSLTTRAKQSCFPNYTFANEIYTCSWIDKFIRLHYALLHYALSVIPQLGLKVQ